MSKDFSHLRAWITGEGYPKDSPSRPVILECVPSRSGASMTVYDRGERIFTVNGCGFDRIGAALGEFLERLFQPELIAMSSHPARFATFRKGQVEPSRIHLEGACGFEAMRSIAEAIALKVTRSESKAGTLIVIEKGV